MEQKKHKILFLSSWNESKQKPTHGIFVKHHAEAVALYCNVAMIQVTSDKEQTITYSLSSKKEGTIHQIKITYKKSSGIPFISTLINLNRYFKAYQKGLDLLQQEWGVPDIIHANILIPVGVIALQQKRKNKIPYILTEHWTGYLPADGNYKGFFKKWWTKRIARNAAYITPVSTDLKVAMQNHGLINNYEVIPNVVDLEIFYPATAKTLHTKKKQIVHVSALDEPQKNISGILRTIKEISETRTDFELHIVGDGAYRKELETLAEKLGLLNTFVFFRGIKLKNELAEILRTSDFFVLFSNYENLPCVLIESLASGIPVITTNTGGIAEYISKEIGIVIEAKNETALKSAISKMFVDYQNYDAAYLNKYADDHFSYSTVGLQFQKIYNKVLNNG